MTYASEADRALLPACCMDFHIDAEHLIFPERMPPEGQEFVRAIGLYDQSLSYLQAAATEQVGADGKKTVYIRHRCQHLQDDGKCGIYASRPKICKTYSCSVRSDCACKGRGPRPGGGLV